MTQRTLPFTLYPKKSKMLLLLLFSSVFAVGGAWMIREGHTAGWLPAGFFGLGVLVAMIQLLPGSSFLTVDEDGIEFCAVFRKCRLKWNEISEFGIYSRESIGVSKTVGFNYSPAYVRLRKMRLMSKRLVGFEAALPDTYGLHAEELAGLLAHYRAQRVAPGQ